MYETVLLRRSYREGGKVKSETLANLSHLPPGTIELIRQSLAGKIHVLADESFEISRSWPHGHVAAVWAQARVLGWPEGLGPACTERTVALAVVIALVCQPDCPAAPWRWWTDTTLAGDLGIQEAGPDDVNAAVDWLLARRRLIEAALAAKPLSSESPPIHNCERRVQAQMFLSRLAEYLIWHLRQAWVPFGAGANENGEPASVLRHLATMTRSRVVFAGGHAMDRLTTPTPTQRIAFQLIGAPIPLTLTP